MEINYVEIRMSCGYKPGKEMMLGSVKDAVAFGANTFMLYTGAPQNTRRKIYRSLGYRRHMNSWLRTA